MRIILLFILLCIAQPVAAQETKPPANPSDSASDTTESDDDEDEDEDDFEDEDGDGDGRSEEVPPIKEAPADSTSDVKTEPSTSTKEDTGSVPAETTGELKDEPSVPKDATNSSAKEAEKPKVDDPIGQCRRAEGAKEKKTKTDSNQSPVDLELRRERRELEKAIGRYVLTAKDFRGEVRTMLVKSIEKRRRLLNERYNRVIDEAADRESKARDDAIARFESFIKKYPDDRKRTPDAMYRLGDLYYEKSEDDYFRAEAKKDKLLALYDRGKLATMPKEPERNYKNSLRTWRKLITKFGKKHRFAAQVYYLIGYIHSEQGRSDEAIVAWDELLSLDKEKIKRFAGEVILRMGEIYFDEGDFAKASSIYKKALQYKGNKYYGLAIYKLAWTYMQQDLYDPAIKQFLDLIAFYDSKGAQGAESQRATAIEVRSEAVEYLGRTFVDNDWDRDDEVDEFRGFERALSYLDKDNPKPYELDILAAYAKALYEEHEKSRYKEAIEVYAYLLERSQKTNSPKALNYQLKLILCHDLNMTDIEMRASSRRDLAKNFGRRSDWYDRNKDNTALIEEAEKQVDLKLQDIPRLFYERALAFDVQAKKLFKEADEPDKATGKPKAEEVRNRLKEQAQQLASKAQPAYLLAAESYKSYMDKYPGSKLVQKMRYNRAESLYFGGMLMEAAQEYQLVAADPRSEKFRDRAALNAILSYQALIKKRVENKELDAMADPNGSFKEPKTPESEKPKGTAKLELEKLPMPPLLENWLNAIDFFISNNLRVKGVPNQHLEFALTAGDIYVRYKDMEGAREKYRQVLACYPKSKEAADAAASIINTYQLENDFPNVEKWVNIIETQELGDPASLAKTRQQIKLFKLGVRAKRAAQLIKEEKFLEAAKEYERLAEETPDSPNADKLYYNAAAAYQEVKYYDSASRLFEKLVTDPRYKKSQFAEDSLLNLAKNYGLFFYYEKAIDAYMAHFNRYPNSKDRAYVLAEAAKAQLDNGELQDAAKTYELYAETFREEKDSPSALFEAGLLYEKLGDVSEQRRVFQEFVDTYKSRAGEDWRILNAKLRLAKIAKSLNKKSKSRRILKEVIAEYNRRGQQPGTLSADVAAEASHMLLERSFESYLKIKLGSGNRGLVKTIGKKRKEWKRLSNAYKGIVTTYRSITWSICALVSDGHVAKSVKTLFQELPEPEGLTDDDLGKYLDRLDADINQYDDLAKRRYVKSVEESRKFKIVHRCSKEALVAANEYEPEQYPIFREEKQKVLYEPTISIESSAVEVNR